MPKLKDLLDCRKEYLKALKKRHVDPSGFREGLEAYQKFCKLKHETDQMRAKRNQKSQEYAKTKNPQIIKDVKQLKKKLAKKEEELEKVRSQVQRLELRLPNWVDESVPEGKDEAANRVVKYVGTPVVEKGKEKEVGDKFPQVKKHRVAEGLLHHADLVEQMGLVDMEKAADIAGARFYLEKNELAMLDLALSLHVMKEFAKKGFKPVVPPYMINREVEEKITYFTSFEDAIYELKDEDLVLITTSEHPLAAMLEGEVIGKDDLPLRLVAFSPAFRREAGSHGKDTKGIFRTHHFNKVELHSVVAPGEDREELEALVKMVEDVMAPLNFPYRIVQNSSGDMDHRALLQYDLEAWFPAQNNFRELHSFATVGTWISEKLNTKIGKPGGEQQLAANLYATGAAIQRTLLAVMVNNYHPGKGVVKLPKVLQDLSGVKEIQLKT